MALLHELGQVRLSWSFPAFFHEKMCCDKFAMKFADNSNLRGVCSPWRDTCTPEVQMVTTSGQAGPLSGNEAALQPGRRLAQASVTSGADSLADTASEGEPVPPTALPVDLPTIFPPGAAIMPGNDTGSDNSTEPMGGPNETASPQALPDGFRTPTASGSDGDSAGLPDAAAGQDDALTSGNSTMMADTASDGDGDSDDFPVAGIAGLAAAAVVLLALLACCCFVIRRRSSEKAKAHKEPAAIAGAPTEAAAVHAHRDPTSAPSPLPGKAPNAANGRYSPALHPEIAASHTSTSSSQNVPLGQYPNAAPPGPPPLPLHAPVAPESASARAYHDMGALGAAHVAAPPGLPPVPVPGAPQQPSGLVKAAEAAEELAGGTMLLSHPCNGHPYQHLPWEDRVGQVCT